MTMYSSYHVMTSHDGLLHSDICGSNACLRLTTAFRSLPRPSSAPNAKASSLRSLKLDLRKSLPCDPNYALFTFEVVVSFTLNVLSFSDI